MPRECHGTTFRVSFHCKCTMSSSTISRSIVLLIVLSAGATTCSDLDETIENLHELLGTESQQVRRDSEDVSSSIWFEYEYNTGAGNRQEVSVKDVSVHEDPKLPENGAARQYLDANGVGFLIHAERSFLSFYEFDPDNAVVGDPVNLTVAGEILAYKAFASHGFQSANITEVDVVAVLCVRSLEGTSLQWHRLLADRTFDNFWLWPVQKDIKHVEHIRRKNRNELLLLGHETIQSGIQYSPIYVYGFSIDFSTSSFDFWVSLVKLEPKVFDIRVCPIYETAFLALQGHSGLTLYEYKDNAIGSIFQQPLTIESHDLRNFVCFESGYLAFLAVSGPEAGLLHFFEDDFQYNAEFNADFNTSEILWIKDIRLDTYRDESLLLLQLENSTVIALGWQGLNFKRTPLPHNVLDQFNLSLVTVIPKFGFVLGNKFVKFHTELKDLKHPSQYTAERLLSLQYLLNDILSHQEMILNETEARLKKSYLKNPVITGFWNISVARATNATVFDNDSVTLGSANLSREDLSFNVTDYMEQLKELERKLNEIDSNLEQALNLNSAELDHNSDVEMFGTMNASGSLNVDELIVKFINDVDVQNDSPPENESVKQHAKVSTIKADNLTVYSLNGIPVTDIRFANSIHNYSGIDFSKIDRAVVEGDLFVETINGVHWGNLMKNVVWKNKDAVIPGDTVIEGSLSADSVELGTLNDLQYPYDYVLVDGNIATEVTGLKSFNHLRVGSLSGLKTINGIDIDDFILLQEDNVLNEEITFEDLIVEGPLKIDCNVTGQNVIEPKLLNETSEITSQVTFVNLTVLGNVIFEKVFLYKYPLRFDDLLLKTDVDAKITGTKTFHGNVEMRSNVTITSGLINGHPMDEFVTTDTEQEFPNLKNVSSLVTFGNVTYKFADRLENLLNESGNGSSCLEKIILFKSPIVVDQLSFDTVNKDVSFDEFTRKLNESFESIVFDRLNTGTLIAEEIAPKEINDVDFANFAERLAASRNITDYSIDNLECNRMDVKFINGMSIDEINDLMNRLSMYMKDLTNGNRSLDSLKVTGQINVNSINGVNLSDLYKNCKSKLIFKNNVTIENLTILGLLNNINFTERVMDTVLKTDNNITVDGHKTFATVHCRELQAISLNDHPLENIFDPYKDQLLTGPVIVNGNVTVLGKFHATGYIGDVKFEDLINRRKALGNNSYEYREKVNFSSNARIKNLVVNGTIQGTDFDTFLKTVIFKNEDNVVISGAKVFKNSVTFNDDFFVHDKLNDIDLKSFWDNAVFIDRPFFIKSKIVFEDDIKVEKDLIVKTNLAAKTVMGIDINELKLGVLYRNQPNYIEETIELTDVIFQSNINVERFNDWDMKLLISLKSEQTIPVDRLRCLNVTVEKFELLGRINDENLKTVQETTFMKTGSQNITGHFNFTGQVRIRRNFNARLINGIDPTRTIPLNSNSTLTGNFLFEKPIILNRSLRVLNGYLNDIDLSRWEAAAVRTSHFLPQIVSGKWTVNGSVYFENGATGSNILNDTSLAKLADTLGKRRSEMDAWVKYANARLRDICQDLNNLMLSAKKQIYRFSVFDYLQHFDFENRIVSLHQFELDGLDYLIISYNTCRMQTYLFKEGKFESVANVTDFGFVHGWITFRDNENLYFLTSGTPVCGRNSTNLWKLENNEFKHVSSLGRKIDSRKVNRKALQKIISRKNEKRSSKIRKKDLEEALSSLERDNDVKIVLQDDQLLLTNSQRANKHDVDKMKNPEVLKFKAGIFEKEIFLYYSEDLSDDHIFICNDHGARKKILQTIKAYKPTSFTALNFEGNVETLLLFVENRMILQIYEYKGIQGFVHRDSVTLNIDKLYNFQIRKFAGLAKRHCLALIHENRLTILEAKMYGEKVDMESLKCPGT
nr:uncharacterized protein LOC117227773 isoform X1 [Megalopta genalis]XP_033339169.1 uncharacterized protein LOC117227773 isoform X2 [Megalopta genalis]